MPPDPSPPLPARLRPGQPARAGARGFHRVRPVGLGSACPRHRPSARGGSRRARAALPLRAGLCGIIGTAPDLTVVGEAATGTEAVALALDTRPDVVLMDVRMPDMDGIEASRLITSSGPVRVLMLTTFDLDEYVYGALRAGASGFLLKDAPPADLLAVVRVVAAGDALLAPGITRRLIKEFAARSAPAPPMPTGITKREREVLVLVAESLSNSEIARQLHITHGTAKTHVGHLLTKLGARDRVQLVVLAHRTGLADGSS